MPIDPAIEEVGAVHFCSHCARPAYQEPFDAEDEYRCRGCGRPFEACPCAVLAEAADAIVRAE